MTRAHAAERQQAIDQLREWIKPGDTVYTILDHVSRSGMQRAIRVVVPYSRREVLDGGHWRELGAAELGGDREVRTIVDHLHPNWAIGKALGLRHWKRHGREQDALLIGGCGMDMGFHLVESLSQVLYGGRTCPCYKDDPREGWHPKEGCADCGGSGTVIGSGYACLGKGTCPSNYHVNHRDRVRCDGPVGGDRGFCYKPDRYSSRYPVPKDWPMLSQTIPVEGEEAITLTTPAACLTKDTAGNKCPPEVCPRCQGLGEYPNPEGPERWDLIHTDGYAIRHRWL